MNTLSHIGRNEIGSADQPTSRARVSALSVTSWELTAVACWANAVADLHVGRRRPRVSAVAWLGGARWHWQPVRVILHAAPRTATPRGGPPETVGRCNPRAPAPPPDREWCPTKSAFYYVRYGCLG